MSTVILDTITGKSTATTITIGSTPVVSASANSMTIRGEGSAQTSIQQGLAKVWCAWTGASASIYDSFNVSGTTDTNATENLVSYTSAFRATGNMSIHYSSNHNGGGLDDNSSSHLCVYSPNTGSAKFLSISNQNTAYQAMTGHGDLA
mgnify:CR=1 FL=1